MSADQPLFTVATITYNSSKWVRQAIESVLASTYTNFEYIISDDCSADDTWEIIQQYNDYRIRSWKNVKNIGEYPNRNKVLNEAKGKFILFIDGDDILYKNSLLEYSVFIKAFPNAKAVWGVYPLYFDFVVLPYFFSAKQLTALNFLSTYPISVVGFADSLFSVIDLKNIGGFDNRFGIGDTYIKRKFSCFFDVLIIPAGKAFWRKHENQASSKIKTNYKNFIESVAIDRELIHSEFFPLKKDELKIAQSNLKVRTIKLLVKNTLMRFKLFDFIRLIVLLRINLFDLFLIFNKGNYEYKCGASGEFPLLNKYNF